MEDLQLTYTQIGLIGGAWPFVYIFVSYPAGLFIDRFGTHKSLLLGSILIALSAALSGFAVDFVTLYLAVAIFGVGGPLISVGLPKLISLWFTGKERGTAAGVYVTGPSAGGMVALFITNSVMLPLLDTWKNVYLIYSLIGFSIAVVWLFLGRRSPPSESSSQTSVTLKDMLKILKCVNVWLIVIASLAFFIGAGGLGVWLPKIFELKGMTPAFAGFMASFLSFSRIIGSLIIPRASYLVGSKKLVISVCLLIAGISTFFMTTGSGLIMWIGTLLSGISLAGLMPLMLVIFMDMPEVGSKYMGAAGGIFFAVGDAGQTFGTFLIGYLKDIAGSFFAGILFVVAVMEVMIIPTILVKEAQKV